MYEHGYTDNYYQFYHGDDGAPQVIQLRTATVVVRKSRRLGCGYEAKKGDVVTQWIGLVDNEFTVDEKCQRCDYADHGAEIEGHGNVDPMIDLKRRMEELIDETSSEVSQSHSLGG